MEGSCIRETQRLLYGEEPSPAPALSPLRCASQCRRKSAVDPDRCTKPLGVTPKYAAPTHQQFLGPAVSLADDGNDPQFVGRVSIGNCVHPEIVTIVAASNAHKSLSMAFLTIKDRENRSMTNLSEFCSDIEI